MNIDNLNCKEIGEKMSRETDQSLLYIRHESNQENTDQG